MTLVAGYHLFLFFVVWYLRSLDRISFPVSGFSFSGSGYNISVWRIFCSLWRLYYSFVFLLLFSLWISIPINHRSFDSIYWLCSVLFWNRNQSLLCVTSKVSLLVKNRDDSWSSGKNQHRFRWGGVYKRRSDKDLLLSPWSFSQSSTLVNWRRTSRDWWLVRVVEAIKRNKLSGGRDRWFRTDM